MKLKAIDPQPAKHLTEWWSQDPTGAAAFVSIFIERPADVPENAKAECDTNGVWFWTVEDSK